MNTYQAGAVIYAKEPKRVAAFYEHVANLRVRHDDSHYVELESSDSQKRGAFALGSCETLGIGF